MLAVAQRLKGFDAADPLERRTRGLRRALLRSVAQTELDRIDPALLGQFVDYALAGKGRGRRARRPVRRDLGPVDDDVERVDEEIPDHVRTERGHCAGGER